MPRKPKGAVPRKPREKKPRAKRAAPVQTVRVSQSVRLVTGEAAATHHAPLFLPQPYNPFPMWSSSEMPRRVPDPLVNTPPVIPIPTPAVPQPLSTDALSAPATPVHKSLDPASAARASISSAREALLAAHDPSETTRPADPLSLRLAGRRARRELIHEARARGFMVGDKTSTAVLMKKLGR